MTLHYITKSHGTVFSHDIKMSCDTMTLHDVTVSCDLEHIQTACAQFIRNAFCASRSL